MVKKILLLAILFHWAGFAFGSSYTIKDTTLKDIGGNVGISTASATSKLFVNGGATVSTLGVGTIADLADTSSGINLNSAIISFYKLEDNTASTTVTDEQSANTGTASGNTSTFTTTGIINNGFSFASGRYVDLGSNSSLKRTGAFSVALWMKTADTSAHSVAGNRSGSGFNVGWQIIVNATNHANKLSWQLDTGSSIANATSTTNINSNAWFFVVGTYDTAQLKLYVNGVSEATAAITGNGGTNAGNTFLAKDGVATGTYTGSIDNFQVFNRALTDSEIQVLYNSGAGTDALSGLFASGTPTPLLVKGSGTSTGTTVKFTDSTGAYRFTVLDNGNVGIGTATPGSSLTIFNGGTKDYMHLNSSAGAGGNVLDITAAGNIGIGSTTPGQKLDVNGVIRSISGGFKFPDGTTQTTAATAGTSSYWTTGNVGINTTSNVGIGTVNPGKLLTVFGDMRLDNSGKYYGDGSQLSGITATATPAGGTNAVQYNSAGTTAGSESVFSMNGANVGIGTTNGTRGILDVRGNASVSGNLGIGTVAPNNLLWIAGGSLSSSGIVTTITGTGASSVPLTITSNNQTTSNTVAVSSSSTGYTGNLLNLSLSGNNAGVTGSTLVAAMTGASSTGTAFRAAQSGSGAVIIAEDQASDPSPFVIDSTGNIGIGTLSANSGKMAIVGNIGIGTVKDGDLYITTAPPNGGMIIEGNVGIGTFNPNGKINIGGSSGIGWTVKTGANTACNTTCPVSSACVFGFDTGLAGSDIVSCSDATADACVCAGP